MSVIEELGLPPLPEPLPRPVIDNHTHLDSTREYSGLGVDDNLRLAREVGVTRVIEVGCDVPGARFAVDLAGRDPQVRAAVALHPNDAARAFLRGGEEELQRQLAQIEWDDSQDFERDRALLIQLGHAIGLTRSAESICRTNRRRACTHFGFRIRSRIFQSSE